MKYRLNKNPVAYVARDGIHRIKYQFPGIM